MKRSPLKRQSIKQTQKERLWNKVKKNRQEEVGDVCELCGKRGTLEAHHIKPRSKGREDTKENCQILCVKCHKKIARIITLDNGSTIFTIQTDDKENYSDESPDYDESFGCMAVNTDLWNSIPLLENNE